MEEQKEAKRERGGQRESKRERLGERETDRQTEGQRDNQTSNMIAPILLTAVR